MDQIGLLNDALTGRYELLRELGHGGMATVYLARDIRHARQVAVKVLRPDLSAMLGGERFLREIGIAATLQHPNILTLIDSGEAAGMLYYVMPFAEGESLRERIAAGPVAVPDAVRWLRDVFDGLAYAHAHGIVHRDVKPDNIMISGRHALVVDFGVAKAMSDAKARSDTNPGLTLTQVGTSIGTPAYMAPEQAAGDPDVDHRADIYAAGVVAYEMLAGRVPFTGRPQEVLAQQVSAAPAPLPASVSQATPPLARFVMRCLEKDPAKRYQTADEALAELESWSTPSASAAMATGAARRGIRTGAAIAAGALVLLVAGSTVAMKKLSGERWVRTEAIPDIQRLVDATAYDSAFTIATRAEGIVGTDSALGKLWPKLSARVALTSTPAGARVWRTTYDDSVHWTLLGTTPTDSIRVPLGLSRFRIEKEGYRPVQLAMTPLMLRDTKLVLDPVASSDGRMVRVSAGDAEVAMPGLSRLPILKLPDFYIDAHEVTNAEYRRFVEAGGYDKPQYWTEPVMDGARTVPFDEARKRLTDRTGRAGPASWEGGDFPAGQGDIPVGGVSWYEASAYAKFAGKSLPTIYHWNRAASPQIGAQVVPGSNFGGTGPVRGSTFRGMSRFGAFDMAGNVREWCWNATGDKRFILGGGWVDGTYAFADAYAQSPLDRSPINGIRLVRPATPKGLGPEQTRVTVVREYRDYATEHPVSDEVFAGFKSFYEYDRTPLNVRTDYRDTTPESWIRERVSFDAAYGGERMAAVLLIPKHAHPPYQAVVVMGGSGMLYTHSDSAIIVRSTDYLVKSGRVVVWPIFKGMYDRNIGLTTDSPQETSAYRDLMVMMVKDARRTVDYLVTRPDVDTARIAYKGISFGGRVSPPILAMEPRFKVALLGVTGLKMEHARAEVDPVNFLPRIHMPVLMLNGRYDYYFPVETSQKPFFEYLGTPRDGKKWIVYPEAHTMPRTELVKEELAWLDRWLGAARLEGRMESR